MKSLIHRSVRAPWPGQTWGQSTTGKDPIIPFLFSNGGFTPKLGLSVCRLTIFLSIYYEFLPPLMSFGLISVNPKFADFNTLHITFNFDHILLLISSWPRFKQNQINEFLTFSFASGFPFSAYGESVFLAFQVKMEKIRDY